jgi:hypothetical protein
MTKLNWDKERANQFVRVDLRNDITSLRDKQIAKFTLGVTRMFVDGQLRDANTIANLNAATTANNYKVQVNFTVQA